MEIRHLKMIVTTAREGSLSRAAEKLYLSQPALSHQLREAEAHFGTAMFLRVNKRMDLTPAGQLVCKKAEHILELMGALDKEVAQLVAGVAGLIRISVECYTCYQWLPPLFRTFKERDVEFEIITEAAEQLEKYFADGRLDCAIVNKKLGSGIHHQKILEDQLVAVVSANHPYAERSFLHPRDFESEHLITYTHPFPLSEHSWVRQFLNPAGAELKKVTKLQLTEAVMELVKTGYGLTVIAKWLAEPYLSSGRLIAIPLGKNGFKREWFAATRKDVPRPGYLDRFIDHMSHFQP